MFEFTWKVILIKRYVPIYKIFKLLKVLYVIVW
jgi:hypothetical protein